MGDKSLFDVSSFMLFEAMGDSEADVNLNLEDIGEDDAMSCSYDISDSASISEYGGYDDDDHHGLELIKGGDHNYYVDYGSDDDDDDEEGVVNQARRGDEMVAQNKLPGVNMSEQQQPQKSSSVCVDPTVKLINKREQDRLFWEACLAS